ncbi:MAG: hypothetical protein HYY18_00050 [Planctomycetes bacterium]|nr:hypothetical protein [Planctomycetota bacterium]
MRTLLALLSCAGLCLAQGTVVLTDTSWKCSASEPAGWADTDFDDTAWTPAVPVQGPDAHGDHYKLPNTLGFASKAQWIWVDATGGSKSCLFRHTLDVPAGWRRAEMLYVADDHAHVWVNGEQADSYETWTGQWGHRGCAVFLDLTPWLREGKNVIAVKGINDGGPHGLGAEIRIDGAPMVPRLRGGDEALPETARKRLDELVKLVEAPATRDDGTKKLIEFSREFGLAVAPVLDKLAAEAADANVAARLGQAIDAAVPEMMPVVPGDGRFAYGRMTLAVLNTHLYADKEPGCLFRWAVSAQVRAHLDPDGVRATVLKAAEDGTELSAERAVRFIGALDFEYGRETLLEVLKARPKTRAGAFAAAGLSRVGKPEDAAALEKAASCGFGPTERAAKAALRTCGK